MPSAILNELRDINKTGKLVPFIGAGFSAPFKIPTWGDLIREYIGKVDLGEKADSKKDIIEMELSNYEYWRALECIKRYGNRTDRDIQEFIMKKIQEVLRDYRDIVASIDNNFADVASLNSKLFLTTNYDDILEKIINYECYVYELRNFDNNTHELFGTKNKVVFHLHGIYNQVSSIIITEETYKELYTANKYKNLFSLLAGGYTFLFLGFSFDDVFIRKILKDINQYFNNKHYIILNNPKPDKVRELKEMYNIETISYDSSKTSHVKEIREIVKYLNS